MKKIIVVALIVIALVCFYYPIFDSEKISYFIIFLCLTVLCFSVAKIYFPSEKENYASVEKEMNQRHTYDGIFNYTDDGFYIKQKKVIERIKWTHIISVHSFSIVILADKRQTGLEIITDKNRYEFTHENSPGLEKFTDQLANYLPDWGLDSPIIRNNAGAEKKLLYQRKKNQYGS